MALPENITIKVLEETKELIIREGAAAKIHIPNGIEIEKLTINAVKEYLSKKRS
jgi:hypothetical protein